MASTTEDIRVRMGLDKTGFDTGLNGAMKSLKYFAQVFGVSWAAGKVNRAIADIFNLGQEVDAIIRSSAEAGMAFDKMAAGIQDVGEVAGVTKDQMEKLKEASKLFDRQDLEMLAKGGEAVDKVQSGFKWFAGKTVASLVSLGTFLPDFLSGNYRDTWGFESVVSQDIRNQRETAERHRRQDDDRKAMQLREDHQKIIQEQLLEEQVIVQKMAEAEQNRLDAATAKLKIDKESARLKMGEISGDRALGVRDRSGWTVAELAAMDASSPFFSAGAIPAIEKARTIQFLENSARFERARGNTGFADTLTREGLFARKELGALTGAEQNPFAALDEMRNALNSILEMTVTDGLPVQPKMAK